MIKLCLNFFYKIKHLITDHFYFLQYRFWQYGEIASEGLRQVAETGSTRMLESELKSESEHIRTIIKARGISYPNVTGKTFAVFRVDRKHHLMSLVSMIGIYLTLIIFF